jgi:hypothetical protein
MRWGFLLVCLGAGSLGCGNSDTVPPGDGGSLSDVAQDADATNGDDADATGPVNDAPPDSFVAMEASGGDDVQTDTGGGGNDSAAAMDGDDGGPGAVEGGLTFTFACGPSLLCVAQTQFCRHGFTGADGSPGDTYACLTIPAQCEPQPSCTCIETTSVSNGCSCNLHVGLVLDCP